MKVFLATHCPTGCTGIAVEARGVDGKPFWFCDNCGAATPREENPMGMLPSRTLAMMKRNGTEALCCSPEDDLDSAVLFVVGEQVPRMLALAQAGVLLHPTTIKMLNMLQEVYTHSDKDLDPEHTKSVENWLKAGCPNATKTSKPEVVH